MMSKDDLSDSEKHLSEITMVLHGQNRKISSVEDKICELASVGKRNSNKLDDLLAQADLLCQKVGIEIPKNEPSRTDYSTTSFRSSLPDSLPSWNSMLTEYDVAGQTLSLDDLLPSEKLSQIKHQFNAPLPREPWSKGDLRAVFGAALVGIIADYFCAPVGNPLSKALENYGMKNPSDHGSHYVYDAFRGIQNRIRGSEIANKFEWLQSIANINVTHDNLPIDFKGKHFGGPHHRILSSGHDLLRFLSGIWQIKNGQFVGVRYEEGEAIMEVFSSQTGSSSPYSPQTDWTTATILYFLHVIADFFTSTSLPIPGTTLLRELPNREIRKFVAQSYQGGINLRHVVGQAVTPMVTSLILVLYNLLRYRLPNWYKKSIKKEKLQEEAVPGLKLNEMMAVSHTLVAGINAGRVLVTGNWFSLNIAQILYCIKTLIGLAIKTNKRHCIVAKYDRNTIYLDQGWAAIQAYMSQPFEQAEMKWPEEKFAIS